MYWGVLIGAICSSLVGQVLLKAGTGDGTGSFLGQLFRWQTIIGLGFYGGAALLYIIALRRIPMSVALPLHRGQLHRHRADGLVVLRRIAGGAEAVGDHADRRRRSAAGPQSGMKRGWPTMRCHRGVVLLALNPA